MEFIHKLGTIALLVYAVSLSYSIANAQTTEKPCSSPEASQLDFWVGEWNAEWTDQEGKIQTGSNTITKIFDGCAVEENFSTGDKSLIGKSLSAYNTVKKMWQQTWVDNSGSYLDFTGGMDGDKMIFVRKVMNKTGKEVIQRMVFYDITKNSFNWNWESSTDNGNTWNLAWKIKYTRKI